MKTLIGYKLLIDANCPMCQLYGNVFEQTKMIEQGTCSPYQTIDASFTNYIDLMRAKNEIALLNTQNNQVFYGIDAFSLILTNRFPILKNVIKCLPINYFLRKLYKFISVNRKIIAPSRQTENNRDCTPDVNLLYRWLYILLVVCFSAFTLFQFTKPINEMMGWQSNFEREILVCFGQIIWQTIFLHKLLKTQLLDYLGNMITVSLIGTLLLLPMFLIDIFFTPTSLSYLIYLGIVVGIMLLEHLRRCKILEISWLASFSWVMYRIFVLAIIHFLTIKS